MSFLAQIPEPQELSSFLSVAFYIIGCVTAVVMLVNQWRPSRHEITNSPLEVKPHPGSVTRDELKQVHGRIERERTEINRMVEALKSETDRRLDKLEEKIDGNTHETSGLSGEIKQMGTQVHRLTNSLDTFLQGLAKK